jgi:hypothetical protein
MSNSMTHTVRGLALAAVLGLTGQATAQDRKPAVQPDSPGAKGGHDAAYEQCAKACNDCEQICAACATHCADLLAQGKKEHLKTLATCRDCATTCAAAAKIVAGKGPFSDLICTACADACKRCGDACDQFKDDPMMKKCADECRKCEKACRDMLQHTGKGGDKR